MFRFLLCFVSGENSPSSLRREKKKGRKRRHFGSSLSLSFFAPVLYRVLYTVYFYARLGELDREWKDFSSYLFPKSSKMCCRLSVIGPSTLSSSTSRRRRRRASNRRRRHSTQEEESKRKGFLVGAQTWYRLGRNL